MTMTPAGTHACDCCGTDLGGGGVARCVVVSDLDKDNPGMVRNLHFCRDRTEGEGDDARTVRGCEHKLLNPATIKHYTETRETTRG